MMPNLQHGRQQQSKQTPRTCLRSICTWSARGLQLDLHLVCTWSTPLSTNWFPCDMHFWFICIDCAFSNGDQLVDTGEDQAKTPLIGFHLVHTWSARSLRLGLPWQLSYHAAGCVGMAQDLTTAVSRLQHRNQLSGWQCRGVCQCRLSVWHGWWGHVVIARLRILFDDLACVLTFASCAYGT